MLELSRSSSLCLWFLSLGIVNLFGILALYFSFKQNKKDQGKFQTLDFFITARKSQPLWKVAWSFFSGAVGAWVLFTPPIYGVSAGILGVVSYAVSTGLPIILLAFYGDKIQKKHNVTNFGDFVYQRYGQIPRIYATIIMIFNMSIALIAEYTAIGDLFLKVLGLSNFPIIICIGIVTMLYTASGGLYVSILTDQLQAIFSIFLLIILTIYVSVTFEGSLGPLPSHLSGNKLGINGIFVMPISMFCATIYSEAPWQRVWAASDPKSLKSGALIATFMITITIFLFGFGGLLVSWAGLESNDPNVVLFRLLCSGKEEPPLWIVLVVVSLAVTMNESAIDSLQNALISSISSIFLKNKPLSITRIAVVIINIPLVVISLKGLPIINLFLLANIITVASSLPMLLSLWDFSYKFISGFGSVFASVFSLFSLAVYGLIVKGSFINGIKFVFFGEYVYLPFIIALLASLVGILIWYTFERLFNILFKKQIKIPFCIPGALETCNDLNSETTK